MTFTAETRGRLDRLLQERLPDHSRSRIAEHIRAGNVRVRGETATKPGTLLKPGYEVVCEPIQERPAHDLQPADIPIEVAYEDDDLLVVCKPRGLATHPASSIKGPTLVNALLWRGIQLEGGETFRPGIVHRLDKATTGLLMVAKSEAAHRSLQLQISRRTAARRYLAWLEGALEGRKRVEAPIGRDPRNPTRMAITDKGRDATTIFEVGSPGPPTLAFVRLETGRTHQIRVHVAAIGHAVLGDSVYNPGSAGPLQLHAASLAFDQPRTGDRVVVYAEPPDDFLAIGFEAWQAFKEWE